MPRHVIDLFHPSARREALTGGKAATLARLHWKGFRIPHGFVVSTQVFALLDRQVQQRMQGEQLGPEQSVAAGAAGESFLALDFPERIERDILRRFHKLDGPVAVRSSLVGEDGCRASCAGQLDSFLNVEEESDLLQAVRKCYASLFGERWASYSRAKAGLGAPDPDGRPAMAVLVQRMIRAKSGGVAFSAEPDTGRVCVIIEAAAGTPEDVVGGRIRPDRYVLSSGGALESLNVSDGGPGILDKSQMRKIALTVTQVSSELAIPQDIEWVFDDTGLYVLQARPITPLAGKNIYSRRLAADMAPGLIKPLYWSTNVVDMAHNVFGRIFGELLGPGAFEPAGLIKLIHSRVYANVTLFAKLLGRLGLPINLFEVLARGDAAIHKRPKMMPRFLRSFGRLLRVILRHGWASKRAEAFITDHDAMLEAFRTEDWSQADTSMLIEAIRSLRTLHGRTQWYMWICAISMMARKGFMSRFLVSSSPGVDSRDLLAGYLDLKSLEPNQAMTDIARDLRAAAPDLVADLETVCDASIRDRLIHADDGMRTLQRFDDFMDRYGHLSASGTDFTVPPWKENPDIIWRTIGRLATQPAGGHSRNPVEIRGEAKARALAGMSWPARLVFERLLAGAITYLKLRERISFCMSEDAYQMRRLYLAIGGALVLRKHMDKSDDVFYLMYDELENLLEGTFDPLVARDRIQTRRAIIQQDAGIAVDDIVCGDDARPEPAAMPEGTRSLAGIPGSAGIARGYARIVTDPYKYQPNLSKEDILIVPFMDVGWTPLFSVAGGIVAETGGQLSHSAIIAREFGLPAVVGVSRATEIIAEGQPITVDGSRGIVHLKHTDR
jgi:phosphohistidine swiveling domain-containing protein